MARTKQHPRPAWEHLLIKIAEAHPALILALGALGFYGIYCLLSWLLGVGSVQG